MSKQDAFGKVAGLLNKFQDRLSNVVEGIADLRKNVGSLRLQVLKNEDDTASIKDRERSIFAYIHDARNAQGQIENTLDLQKATNKETTESLYKLRDSVQKSFDGVGTDVKSLLTAVQRLNARLGEIESQYLICIEDNKVLKAQINATAPAALESRLKVVEDTIRYLRVLFTEAANSLNSESFRVGAKKP